jgi:hypothetical protein
MQEILLAKGVCTTDELTEAYAEAEREQAKRETAAARVAER